MHIKYQRLDSSESGNKASGNKASGKWSLSKKPFFLGRSSECQYVIQGEGVGAVSGQHAQLVAQGASEVTLEDLGSTNGTFVNGERLTAKVGLKQGDTISLGKSGPKFELLGFVTEQEKEKPQPTGNSGPAPFGYMDNASAVAASSIAPAASPFGAAPGAAPSAVSPFSDASPLCPSQNPLVAPNQEAIPLRHPVAAIAWARSIREVVIAFMGNDRRKWKLIISLATGIPLLLVVMFLIWPQGTFQANSAYQRLLSCSLWIINAQDGTSGTGVLIKHKGKNYALTNYHVVGSASEVIIFAPQEREGKLIVNKEKIVADQKPIIARVLARNPAKDVALLELESLPKGVRPISLARTSVREGDRLFTVGNPGATEEIAWVFGEGVARQVVEKELRFEGNTFRGRGLMSQLSINPGDSGGPIVNDDLELVGINMGHHSKANLITWGVDVSELKYFLKQYAQ